MNNIFPFIDTDTLALAAKVFLLFLVALYTIFAFFVFNHIRSFQRILIISSATGSPLIQTLVFMYLIATISLFALGVVIL